MASITQYRGKTWRAIIRRVGYPSQSKTFNTKREAQAWVAETERSMVRGSAEFDTVRDVFDQYLSEVAIKQKNRNAPATIKRLMRDAVFMSLRVNKIQPANIRDWRDARAQEVSKATVNREMNAISGVFTHAIKEWSLPLSENPCHSVAQFKGADKARNMVWEQGDVETLLNSIGWSESLIPKTGRDYVGWALLIALETAMRIGELCRPTVADFHPEERYVFLNDTKNGEQRKVPLSLNAMRYISHLCANRKPSEKIIPLTSDTLGEYMRDAKSACGLSHLVMHDARHTAATNMSKKLSNVLELAAVTGHKSLVHLKRYYHPKPLDLANKLG